MKQVIVNRKSFPASFKSCKNFGQLIQWVENFGEREKHFIVRMELNGKFIDEEEEKLLDNMSIDDVQEIVVNFSPVEEIMSKTMSSVITMIQDLQLKSIDFAQEMRKAPELEEEKMKGVLVKSRRVIDSLEELFRAHVNKKFHLRHHSLWNQAEAELTNILQCILQSFEMGNKDFLSDLLEYELTHALQLWEEVLEKEILDNPSISNIFQLKNGGTGSDNKADV